MTVAEKLDTFWQTYMPDTAICSRCPEPLDHEAERDAGICFDCQAEEAGFEMPEPAIPRLRTMAEIDHELHLIHVRKLA
jgi:hypothetical protein